MSNSKQADLIIIGGGIAGTNLALEAIRFGLKPVVFDAGDPASASRMAAGVINPITGRSMNKSWMVDDFLPSSDEFYKYWEKETALSFYRESETIRYLPNTKAENDWTAKQGIAEYSPYLDEQALFDAPEGYPEGKYFLIKGGRVLNIRRYLNAMKLYLFQKGCWVQAEIRERDIKKIGEDWSVNSFISANLVLAQGALLKKFSFFRELPLVPNRGQMRILQIPGIDLKRIAHFSGQNLTPLFEEETFYLGSTYEREETEAIATEKGDEQLQDRFAGYFNLPFRIIERGAGIRPTVIDRKPLIGCHPKIKGLYLFNGMGNKGVSQSPLLAKFLLNHIFENQKLPSEIDLNRFNL
jgi:glycine/D-amino acid oxidase-like deaminating enzyme